MAGYSCLGKNPRFVNRYVVETAAPGGTVPTFLAASETDPTWTFRNAEADVSRVGAACISKYSEEYLPQPYSRDGTATVASARNRNGAVAG